MTKNIIIAICVFLAASYLIDRSMNDLQKEEVNTLAMLP